MRPIFIFILFLSSILYCQLEEFDKSNSGFGPKFSVDIINSASDIVGKTKVEIYFQFPYSSLQFVKSGEKFVSNYTITIEAVEEESEDIVITDLYEESIETFNYESSISSRSSKISFRTLELNPGKYEFRITLLDSESSKEYRTSIKYQVIDSSADTFISDIMLIRNSVQINGRERLVPNISKLIIDSQSNLSFYFKINSQSDQIVNLVYRLTDFDDEKLFEVEGKETLKKGNNAIIKTLSQLDLPLGKYKLEVFQPDNQNSLRVKMFNSVIKGFPPSITDLEEAIKQIKYIASGSEIDEIDNDSLTYRQKLDKFVAFWKSKDPDPSTELNEILIEYYNRIEFANRTFKGYREGWKTDMGFVYVIFGNPDTIDRNPFNSGTKPYEVWHYDMLNKRFIFVDENGFGDYRLLNYDFRDMTNFRY